MTSWQKLKELFDGKEQELPDWTHIGPDGKRRTFKNKPLKMLVNKFKFWR